MVRGDPLFIGEPWTTADGFRRSLFCIRASLPPSRETPRLDCREVSAGGGLAVGGAVETIEARGGLLPGGVIKERGGNRHRPDHRRPLRPRKSIGVRGHDPAFHRPTCRPVEKLRHVGAVQIGMAATYGRIIGELVAQRELQA